MNNACRQTDFDELHDDLIVYLAERLGVSQDEAQGLLGDWLTTFGHEHPKERVARRP